jgi:flagellar biosynthetic protein FliR
MTLPLDFLPALVMAFLLIFARTGAIFMALPGFGEMFISPRIRLSIALAVTLVMFPLLKNQFGPVPPNVPALLLLLAHEILFGAFIGLIIRFVRSALQTAGAVIAQQVGVGFVTQVDPTQGGQGLILGNFMAMFGVVLVFATDMHHLALAAIHDSYTLFPPTAVIDFGDFSASALKVFTSAFALAIQISAPFLVAGLVFQASIGVLSRLMPALPIFFIALPLQIMAGFLLLAVLLATMATWYTGHLDETFRLFIVH